MVKRMKWEYLQSDKAELMNRLGLEGWELVGVTAAGSKETFYYKRPAPSVSECITLEQRERVLKGGEPS